MGLNFVDAADMPAGLPERPLQQTRKNEIAAAIQQLKMDVSGFEWKLAMTNSQKARSAGGGIVEVLFHPSTRSYFMFDGIRAETVALFLPEHAPYELYISEFYPGVSDPIETPENLTSEQQLSHCLKWLSRVKIEAESPDLWAETLEAKAILPTRIDNEPFTTDEKAKLAAALERIEQRFAQMAHGTDEFHAQVQSEFAAVRQALEYLGRRDWQWLFYGALMAWGMGAVLDDAGMADLFQFSTSQLGTALGQAVGYVQDAIKTTKKVGR